MRMQLLRPTGRLLGVGGGSLRLQTHPLNGSAEIVDLVALPRAVGGNFCHERSDTLDSRFHRAQMLGHVRTDFSAAFCRQPRLLEQHLRLSRGFDCRIERQQVGLGCDLVDPLDDERRALRGAAAVHTGPHVLRSFTCWGGIACGRVERAGFGFVDHARRCSSNALSKVPGA